MSVYLGVACCLGLVAMFVVTPARAGQARLFTGSFGGASTTVVDPYPLSTVSNGLIWGSVAVDSASNASKGDVYVADAAAYRVEKFDSSGHFLLMFGGKVNKTAVEEARPQAEQNVCPAIAHPADVCQAGTAGTAPGYFESVMLTVAVDSSSGPSSGDVYVADLNPARYDGNGDNEITKFDESGGVVSSWGSEGQLDGSAVTGPLPGPFESLAGITVDPSGNLWVSSGAAVFEFAENAGFIRDWGAPQNAALHGFAVDSLGGVYLGGGKFTSTGEGIATIVGGVQGIGGIALNTSTNDVYVVAELEHVSPPNAIERFESSCKPSPGIFSHCVPAEAFGSPELSGLIQGLAIDSTSPGETLYADPDGNGNVHRIVGFSNETVPDVTTSGLASVSSTSAVLSGVVNPSGVPLKECFFEWGEGEGESAAYGHVAACEPAATAIPADSNAHGVRASIGGLHAGGIYHFRLVAGNANDVNAAIDEPAHGVDVAFGPPSVSGESVSEVTATSAIVGVVVDPHDVDTSVRVEYGTEPGVFGSVTPEVDVGSAGFGQSVSFQLRGLTARTVYYYRVRAENALGSRYGEERVLTTQAQGGVGLLDDRAWELVSPPDKLGANIKSIDGGVVQAAASGDAITYVASAPTEAEAPGNAKGVKVFSARGGSGWSSRDISTPNESASGIGIGFSNEYRAFSNDLSVGLVQRLGAFLPSLSGEASEDTPYLRSLLAGGDPEKLCSVSCFRPLVTGAPGFENVPSGTVFGAGIGPSFLGATPDLSHVLISSQVALTENAPADSLYEWSAGHLALVSVLPDKQAAPTSSGPGFARGGISTDGSRVVWSAGTGNERHLYLRDMTLGATLQLDTVQPGVAPETEPKSKPQFQLASSDGSRVFFTDTQALTTDSGASGSNGPDLYECAIVETGNELGCDLTDLTPLTSKNESANVVGAVIGAAEDGSSVYFVANGVLTTNKNADGDEARPGKCEPEQGGVVSETTCNLYVYREGKISLVTVLSGEDNPDWSFLDGHPRLDGLTGRVSADGDWLAFMSQRSLSGYDNRDAASGQPDEEVYLYRASDGKLVCASCDPTGARPHGTEYAQIQFGATGGFEVWNDNTWLAANIPGWTAYGESAAIYQSRYLSASGRLFFNSSDALVPQDVNAAEDVYEYEPVGVGSCTDTSVTFDAMSGGCVGLVSSGTSPEESGFLDASESGDDVFFLTSAQLSRRDTDTALDVYDAHVDGGEPEAVPPVECQGDACQHPVAAPEDPTPGSLTYRGPGNITFAPAVVVKTKTKPMSRAQKLASALKVCHKRPKRKRAACERSARKTYGSSARKATTIRGSTRLGRGR